MSDLSQETRDLIARGRDGEALPAARRRRLKTAILAQATVASIATTTTTAAAWTTMAAKAVLVVSAIAIAGTGIGVISARIDHASDVRAQSATAKKAAPSTVIPAVPVPSALRSIDPPIAVAPIAPIAETAEPVRPEAEPVHHATIARPVAAPRAPVVAIEKSAPAPLPSPVAQAASGASNPLSSAPASSLAEEARLLRDAHRALNDGDGSTALALLDQHASRFPNSALEPERSAERVLALCQQGRVNDARAAAATFIAAHPSGPLATRVRGSCGHVGGSDDAPAQSPRRE